MQRLAVILLAIYLIMVGLLSLLAIRLPGMDFLIPLLALAAGILLLISSTRIELGGRYAVLLLSVYLILIGVIYLFSVSFPASGIVLGLLAIAAGVLILLRR